MINTLVSMVIAGVAFAAVDKGVDLLNDYKRDKELREFEEGLNKEES